MNASVLGLNLLSATAFAAVATPVVAFWMWRWKILDVPDGVRKLHAQTVPLGGGVAVLVACVLSTVMVLLIYPLVEWEHGGQTSFLAGLSCACLGICVLGILDDSGLLRGRQKFMGQVVVALIVTTSGCVISRVEFMDIRLELGVLALPFTVFWLVGSINAVNLIDGVDGLAASVGVILSGTFALMAWLTGHELEAILGISLCGSLLGFLPYNFPRARIFLGDTGSMLIGLLLGTLALRSSVKSQATLALAAPVAVLSILIFDVGMAILRRKLTGRSLYSTDRGHLHHRLTQLGFPPVGVVLFVCLACVLCSAGALASLVYRNEWIALSVASAVILGCVLAKVFGHNEFRLLRVRTQDFVRSLFRLTSLRDTPEAMSTTQIQGRLDWTPVWRDLRVLAQSRDLLRVELQISAPRVHECYHAEWLRRMGDADQQWLMSVPVIHQQAVVGRIDLSGELNWTCSHSSAEQIAEIVQGLKPMEIQIEGVLAPVTLTGPGVLPGWVA